MSQLLLFTLLFIFGVSVGTMSGLLGIGGGIALVPGLMYLFHFTQKEAQGTSLAVMIPPIGLFAAMVYYQAGHVKLPVVGFVALGFVVGAYLGARMLPLVPQMTLQVCFGALLLYVGFMFVFAPVVGQRKAALPAGIATLVSGIFAWAFHRKIKRKTRGAGPTEDIDYHI